MQCQQFSPPPDLAQWVECVWVLRGAVAPEGQTILPDGRMELVFHFSSPPATTAGQQPEALIAGQMLSALHLTPRGDMDALGVRLQPAAGACLLPSALLTGTLHPMDSVLGPWARRAREQAGNERAESSRPAIMFSCLRRLLNGKPEPDAAIASSVQRIERADGCGDMDGFMPPGLQTRQWQRRFVASTGLAPKAFARIVRLQKLVALYQSGRRRRWVDLALESGFCDQAHLAHDFRLFSGQSPAAFFSQGRGFAEFYRDGFLQDRHPAKPVQF